MKTKIPLYFGNQKEEYKENLQTMNIMLPSKSEFSVKMKIY